MNTLRAVVFALVVTVAGFAGAQALANESPPLVANCVNAAEGWTIQVLGLDCSTAATLVRKVDARRPTEPMRIGSKWTCTAGYARKFLVTVRCSGPSGKFLRAAQAIPGAARPAALPPIARCPNYVDRAQRRWNIWHERFGCDGARAVLIKLAGVRRPTQDDVQAVQRGERFTCYADDNGGLPTSIRCSGWGGVGPSSWWFWFGASVEKRQTPTTTGGTITVRRSAAYRPEAPGNPAKSLVLQRSDFPAGTIARDSGGSASAAGSGYGVTYLYRTGDRPNELTASVAVFKSLRTAKAMFAESRAELGAASRLRLPRYGDEQVAVFSSAGGSQLIVRTGPVVWVLGLQTVVTRGGATHELTRAEAVAEYLTYAPKQRGRIAKEERR